MIKHYRKLVGCVQAIRITPELSFNDFMEFVGDLEFEADADSIKILTPNPGEWIVKTLGNDFSKHSHLMFEYLYDLYEEPLLPGQEVKSSPSVPSGIYYDGRWWKPMSDNHGATRNE
jgi:hypothetical protein